MGSEGSMPMMAAAWVANRLLQTLGWAGAIKIVSRWFPSSKTCSSCGTVKETLDLTERVFVCEDCGYVADRDYNAAKTLAAAG